MKNVLTFLHGSGRVYFWVHLLHLLVELGLAYLCLSSSTAKL